MCFRWSEQLAELLATAATEAVSPLPAPIPLNDVECQFQLSFKTKVVQGLFNDKGDL